MEQSSGRSGYWRLFFSSMQEESLRKEKEALTAEIQKAVGEGSAKAKKPVKLEPLVPLETYEPIQFKRKSITLAPIPWGAGLQEWVAGISDKTQQMYADFWPLLLRMQEEARRRIEAVREADYRIRLILLLSA